MVESAIIKDDAPEYLATAPVIRQGLEGIGYQDKLTAAALGILRFIAVIASFVD
jgi:hypothetical protein